MQDSLRRKEKLKELFKEQYAVLQTARELLSGSDLYDKTTLLAVTKLTQRLAEKIGCVSYDIKAEQLASEVLALEEHIETIRSEL